MASVAVTNYLKEYSPISLLVAGATMVGVLGVKNFSGLGLFVTGATLLYDHRDKCRQFAAQAFQKMAQICDPGLASKNVRKLEVAVQEPVDIESAYSDDEKSFDVDVDLLPKVVRESITGTVFPGQRTSVIRGLVGLFKKHIEGEQFSRSEMTENIMAHLSSGSQNTLNLQFRINGYSDELDVDVSLNQHC